MYIKFDLYEVFEMFYKNVILNNNDQQYKKNQLH